MADLAPLGILGIQGRNGFDSTLIMPNNQCKEAYNVDFYGAGLCRKRGGSDQISLTILSGNAFSGPVASMGRFVPTITSVTNGTGPRYAELWAVDFGLGIAAVPTFHRLQATPVWTNPTVLDPCTAVPGTTGSDSAQEINWQSFNGKFFIAYKSAHNRLHVWDGATVRRVGLDTAAAPVMAIGVGSITDTRRYRVAWTKQTVGGVTTQRSNLGPATASQVMAGGNATATRPALINEGETHWELWAASTASAFGDYRLVGTAPVGTATILDDAPLSSTVAPAEGANTLPPSARYLSADSGRMILSGCYETAANAENAATPSDRRVWWTAAPGSGTGDDERIPITGTINGYADVEETITGHTPPMGQSRTGGSTFDRGSFYVFSYESQWKFTSTGDATTPYLISRMAGGAGCVHHKSIVVAFDINGDPSIYWWSKNGPVRLTSQGQQFLGRDLDDILQTVNYNAQVPVHAVYHTDKNQVWFHVATGTSTQPNLRLVFDTTLGRLTKDGIRLGWAVHEGDATLTFCSCMYADVITDQGVSKNLKPYVGLNDGSYNIWKCDSSSTTDVGRLFQGYLDTKSYAPWGLGNLGGTQREAFVVASPSPGTSIRLTLYRDEGAETLHSKASLTDTSDTANADKVFGKFDNSQVSSTLTVRCRIGDALPSSAAWKLDALVIPVTQQGQF